MLSRTADHLFWMARYMERAENTARMLDVNYQTSLLPQSAQSAEMGWKGLLSISELSGDFAERIGEVTPKSVMNYMVLDARNPSSIHSCLKAARENARAVRGALTTEVWETQNQTWLEFQRMADDCEFLDDPSDAFDWVKFRSHLSRGVVLGTMLKDEAFHFLRIGSCLERADNSARLLDVKFHALQSDVRASEPIAGGMSQVQDSSGADALPEVDKEVEFDFYHWSALLRSVSGFEVYRKTYRNVIRPEKVAELMILRQDMPRSLACCMNEVLENLRVVANAQSGETLRRVGRLCADLQYARIEEILETGLHAYLTQFLERVGNVGVAISRDFLVPVEA
ncbi:MAG: alpha-E domain-containing protein [Ideonella sp.]